MYSREHFVLGAVTAALLAVPLAGSYSLPVLAVLLAYGVGLSVFIDLDHFAIARLRTGDWSHLRACLADPKAAFTDQERIFDDLDPLRFERLLSHLLVGGALTVASFALRPSVAVFTAVVVYVHVVADLLRDAEIA